MSPDQSFVLVAETGAYRVKRLWLQGAHQDQTEIFIDNLPGFPDGISSDADDIFWLALFAPRNQLLDLMPRTFLRKVLMRFPAAFQAEPARYGFVLGLRRQGTSRA